MSAFISLLTNRNEIINQFFPGINEGSLPNTDAIIGNNERLITVHN